jgi:hypothetical protein
MVFMHAADRPAGVRREVERFEMRTTVGHGLNRKLAVFANIPYAEVTSDIGGARSEVSGLADVNLFARYEIHNVNRPGGTLRVAPFAGLRVPTGRKGRTGDGSVDVFGGLVVTLASIDWGLDSQLRYDLNREADGFDRGDVLRLESSLQYRLSPDQVSARTEGFLFGVLELSAGWSGRDQFAGTKDANSGGFQVTATPGLQYATRRWIADFGLQVPLVSDLNGTALRTDIAVLSSIRFNF